MKYKRTFAPIVCVLLISCMGKQVRHAHAIETVQLESDSEKFYGADVVVSGYFNREWLIPDENGTCAPKLDQRKRLYVVLKSKDNLRVSKLQFRWITVRGKFNRPRDFEIDSGDLSLIISESNMFGILEDGQVEEIDDLRTCHP